MSETTRFGWRPNFQEKSAVLSEFKEFIEKFNVIPIAIGLVLALAFAPMVDALVAVILSLVGAIFGAELSFDQLTFQLNGTPIPYGGLITAIVTFLMIAWVVFMIVKGLAKAGAQTTLNETPDQVLLGEIRDLLKSR